MFEVKIHFKLPGERCLMAHTLTVASFDNRHAAVRFATAVDRALGVTVQDVALEDNPDRNFGLVYDRTEQP